MNVDYKPKTPYKPVNESSRNTLAGLAGNVAQGNSGSTTRNYNYNVNPSSTMPPPGSTQWTPEVPPTGYHLNPSGTMPPPEATPVNQVPPIQYNYQPYATTAASTQPYTNVNPSTPATVNNPYPNTNQIPTTNYFQNPIPQNTINAAQAIADTPDANKDIAQMVINAYTQHLGRLPDEQGYFAHLHRALQMRDAGQPVTWQTITDWIRDSEEGARYQTERDVALQVDPELQSMQQAYERWKQENLFNQQNVRNTADQSLGKYGLDYQNTLEDLARQVASSRVQTEADMNKRGLWHSGVLDKSYQTIDQNNMLAQGRIGKEYFRNVGNILQDMDTNIAQLSQRADLYGGQYNTQLADLMQRREQLVSQALDKLLEQRQEEQRWQTQFDRDVMESDRDYALRLMAAQGSGGGGGGGGGGGFSGSGAGGSLTAAEGDAITQMVLEKTANGMSPEAAINSVLGAAQLGQIPGVSAAAVGDWMYNNSDANGGYPAISAAAAQQQGPGNISDQFAGVVDSLFNWR